MNFSNIAVMYADNYKLEIHQKKLFMITYKYSWIMSKKLRKMSEKKNLWKEK